VLPSQQPVQQYPAPHDPFVHFVPLGAELCWQVPEEQLSVVQSFVSAQLLHAAPAFPQAVLSVPAVQLEPSQHPLQQLPARQVPPEHGLPSTIGVVSHVPATQLPPLHGSVEDEQPLQVPPPLPHEVLWSPFLQTPFAQHPEQRLSEQLPPHPSLSPAHLSLQLGAQSTHLPDEQDWSDLQVPQTPPHPSSPHSRPTQSAEQLLHEPEEQVPNPLVGQSRQVAPLLPQLVSSEPARQEAPSELQHPVQLVGSHTHLSW
jgi:hypothetical protein